MLMAAVSELKIVVVGILCFVALAALVIYLPVALVREVTRTDDEVLPSWMGSVPARRTRVRVVVMLLGSLLALAIFTTAWVSFQQE